MLHLTTIEEAREKAKDKYLDALKALSEPNADPTLAQQANDTYLEFKKLDREYQDRKVLNKMEQLFGC